ncbi:hypothetical protein V6N13_110357 [Hibiscus sabdariffa]
MPSSKVACMDGHQQPTSQVSVQQPYKKGQPKRGPYQIFRTVQSAQQGNLWAFQALLIKGKAATSSTGTPNFSLFELPCKQLYVKDEVNSSFPGTNSFLFDSLSNLKSIP